MSITTISIHAVRDIMIGVARPVGDDGAWVRTIEAFDVDGHLFQISLFSAKGRSALDLIDDIEATEIREATGEPA